MIGFAADVEIRRAAHGEEKFVLIMKVRLNLLHVGRHIAPDGILPVQHTNIRLG